MTTSNNQNSAPATADEGSQSNQPVFNIQRLYLKEASLEQPNSPQILFEQTQPTVDIQLQLANSQIDGAHHEVVVTASVHTKIGDRTLFLVEVKQAGIFEVRNIAQQQVPQVLGITCPQIIYPYLRSNIADLITRAGFPPVQLVEINFQAMFEAQLQQQAQQKQDATGTTTIA